MRKWYHWLMDILMYGVQGAPIVLKLTGVIAWSWTSVILWAILFPLALVAAFCLLITIILVTLITVALWQTFLEIFK